MNNTKAFIIAVSSAYFSMFMVVTIFVGIEETKDFLVGSKEILFNLGFSLQILGQGLKEFLADADGALVVQNTIVGTIIPLVVNIFSFPTVLGYLTVFVVLSVVYGFAVNFEVACITTQAVCSILGAFTYSAYDPLRNAVTAIWVVLSKPSNLVQYVIVLFFLRIAPALTDNMSKTFEKSMGKM